MKTVILSLIAGLAVMLNHSVVLADHNSDEALKNRISETGTLNIMSEEAAAAKAVLATEAAEKAAGPVDGKAVYDSGCSACHVAGLLEAPIFGNADAWATRIAKGNNALIDSVTNGLGNMPAQSPALSEEQIAAAVAFIVDNSQ